MNRAEGGGGQRGTDADMRKTSGGGGVLGALEEELVTPMRSGSCERHHGAVHRGRWRLALAVL